MAGKSWWLGHEMVEIVCVHSKEAGKGLWWYLAPIQGEPSPLGILKILSQIYSEVCFLSQFQSSGIEIEDYS